MQPVAPQVPINDYRMPQTQQPAADASITPESANLAAPTAPEAPAGSPATAIIVGLIVLAVLLVALAAVVGVMAAQRAKTTAPAGAPVAAAGAAVPAGWAYLTAPGAPNISLQKSPFLVGSSADCDLRLADPKASPQHVRIARTEAGYVLSDLNSLNGTFLNGERIASPVTLRPGDQIQMGDISVTFEIYLG